MSAMPLVARVAKAAGRVALDRAEGAIGRALPDTPERLATPAAVNEVLRLGTPRDAVALPPVRAVRLPGVDFESSNCTNFLIEVDFGAESFGPDREPLPRTLYVKLPCPEWTTRVFANATGFWDVEAAFCARVAPLVPIRTPRVYAVARRGGRFVLLLENLHETPGTKLFLNRDMAAGTTIERARRCLASFAELHATFWGWPEARRDALLPPRLHLYLSRGGRGFTRALNAAAIAPAQRAAPDLVEQRHVALFRQALDRWDALVHAWYGGPLTLIHGDSHLANCFEFPAEGGVQVGMLDFQGMHWCDSMRDVQYFLTNSLEPALLAAHEVDLVEGYRQALADGGIALSAERAWDQYRAFAFQTLMVSVTSIGLGGLTERDETVRTVLRRSLAAIDRLDFEGWLAAL